MAWLKVLSVAAIVGLAAAASSDHDIVMCQGGLNSSSFTTKIVASPKDFQDIIDIKVSTMVDLIEFEPISCLKVVNQNAPKDEGYPSIESGGIQQGEFTVQLVSQVGKSLNYTIEIVAKARDTNDRSL